MGSVLLWQTPTPPELKNFSNPLQTGGLFEVLLDGQQRLTTLYMLIKNAIPPYYTEVDKDPRLLYFNLRNREFQYEQSLLMQRPEWVKVVDCFQNQIDVSIIARQQVERESSEGDVFKRILDLIQIYQASLGELLDILKIPVPLEIVPATASINEAIDIFDNVNSEGTRLVSSELALTHVTGHWPKARQILKAKGQLLDKKNFPFPLDFLTRALTAVVTGSALFPAIHNRKEVETREGWEKLSVILDYLVAVLPSAHIHSLRDLSTPNLLIPLVVYLHKQGGHFPNHHMRQKALQWLYRAMIWTRYSSQTDQKLEIDVKIVMANIDPWPVLTLELTKSRADLSVSGRQLADVWRSDNPFYAMLLITTRAQKAVDWFSGISLSTPQMAVNRNLCVQLFSQKLLETHGYKTTTNRTDQLNYRGIGNRVFTFSGSTLINDLLPHEILATVEENYPGALEAQFIPRVPELWYADKFLTFVETRRGLMAEAINRYIEGLTAQTIEREEIDLAALIALGESDRLEFKATMLWDIDKNG